MNFMEAVKAMKEGKKVRREEWGNKKAHILLGSYAYIGHKSSDDGSTRKSAMFKAEDVEATDWQIYEEEDNWNLADAIHGDPKSMIKRAILETFIRKVKEDMNKLNYQEEPECNLGRKKERRDTLELIENRIDKRMGDL